MSEPVFPMESRIVRFTPELLGLASPEYIETTVRVLTSRGDHTFRVIGWDGDRRCLITERINGD